MKKILIGKMNDVLKMKNLIPSIIIHNQLPIINSEETSFINDLKKFKK